MSSAITPEDELGGLGNKLLTTRAVGMKLISTDKNTEVAMNNGTFTRMTPHVMHITPNNAKDGAKPQSVEAITGDSPIVLANPDFRLEKLHNRLYADSAKSKSIVIAENQSTRFSYDSIPQDIAIIFYHSEQRLRMLAWNSKTDGQTDSFKQLLDIGKSSRRDRLIITGTCELFFYGTELDSIANSLVINLSKESSEVVDEGSFRSSEKALNGVQVDLSDLDGGILGNNGNQTSDVQKRRPTAQLLLNGKEVAHLSKTNSIMAITCRNSKSKSAQNIQCEQMASISDSDSVVASLILQDSSVHLVFPRVKAAECAVFLAIPANSPFCLLPGDHISFHGRGNDKPGEGLLSVQLDVPFLRRSCTGNDTIHVSQYIRTLGLDVPMLVEQQDPNQSTKGQNRNNSTTDTLESRQTRLVKVSRIIFSTNNDSFQIGRKSKDLFLPDPHLSKYHARISRVHSSMFEIKSESGKPIFLLLGKSNRHVRPPTALKVGDTIALGKSEFKVVVMRAEEPTQLGFSGKSELQYRLQRNTENHLLKLDTVQKNLVDTDQNTIYQLVSPKIPASGPALILLCIRGSDRGKLYECDWIETVLGSGPNVTIPIEDARVSSSHCRIYYDRTHRCWFAEDLQSQHGTFLKLDSVDEGILVSIGDVFVLGQSTMQIMTQTSKAPTPPVRPCCSIQ